MKDALKEFQFAIPRTQENVGHLENLGYRRGVGDYAYEQKFLVVMPFKMIYYPVCGHSGINVTTEDEEIIKTKLVVKYPK